MVKSDKLGFRLRDHVSIRVGMVRSRAIDGFVVGQYGADSGRQTDALLR